MEFFREVCQTSSQQLFYMGVSGFLQAAIFVYSVVVAGIGLHILFVVTDNIGPILDEDSAHLSVGISMELLSGFIVSITLCNAFVCTGYACALYTILNVENYKLHRTKIVSFSLSQVILGFGVLSLGVLCLLQSNRLDVNVGMSIIQALPFYRSRMELKSSIDKMQIYYQCCGSTDVSDWFGVDWYRKLNPGDDPINTAPFSCCDRNTMTPCLSKKDINTFNVILKAPLKDIWYSGGCAEAIKKRVSRSLLLPVGAISVIFFVIQMIGTYLSYLILHFLNEQKPKEQFQKLHFDMNSFDHDTRNLKGLACETCSSSENENQALKSSALHVSHYNRLQKLKEYKERPTTSKPKKHPHNRVDKKEKYRKDKKESKSAKKEEITPAREVEYDGEVEEAPVIVTTSYNSAANQDGESEAGAKDNVKQPIDYCSNEAAAKNNIENEPDLILAERVNDNRIKISIDDFGATVKTEKEEEGEEEDEDDDEEEEEEEEEDDVPFEMNDGSAFSSQLANPVFNIGKATINDGLLNEPLLEVREFLERPTSALSIDSV